MLIIFSRLVAPTFIGRAQVESHLTSAHRLKARNLLESIVLPSDFRRARCSLCEVKIYCRGREEFTRHMVKRTIS